MHRRRELEDRRRDAASLLAIAGSYQLLLDVVKARDALRTAAAHFRLLGSSFAYPVAVCAADTSATYSAVEATEHPLSAVGHAHVLLALSWVNANELERHDRD